MSAEVDERNRQRAKNFIQKVGVREFIKKWTSRLRLEGDGYYPSTYFGSGRMASELQKFVQHDGRRVIVEIDTSGDERVTRVYVAVGGQDQAAFDAAERMLRDGLLGE